MTPVSWIQIFILVVLIGTSAGLFWRRLNSVLKIIRASRQTPDFEVAPVGPRVWDFVWEVLGQAKVSEKSTTFSELTKFGQADA